MRNSIRVARQVKTPGANEPVLTLPCRESGGAQDRICVRGIVAPSDITAEGVELLAANHKFEGQVDLNHSRGDARMLLQNESKAASVSARSRAVAHRLP